ncbi:MAG: lipoate--protein ligase family protein, partial [Clostridiales bacterium]|nr:lipoate--protein ligase family protein [Clostridiales bacterium]
MIYIENTNNDPRYNLAFEEYVFLNTDYDEPILLLWQNGPAVIVGKYQNTLEEVNYDFIKEKGINIVRRNTGGGAVYHDLGNLNYSFIIPDVQSKIDFKTFTIPVVKALESAGVQAEQTGRNDILVDGKKFSGNAQQFSNHKLLHHGTLMFDVNTDDVAKALKVKEGKFKSKATKSVKSRVTNLKPYLGDITVEDFKNLLIEWFDREYGLKKVELTEKQKQEILDLRERKYATDDWNLGKSPK